MDSFPDDFNVTAMKEKLLLAASNSDSAKHARKYIMDQFKKYSEMPRPYFVLHMKDYEPYVRQIVLMDVKKRFPLICYQELDDYAAFNYTMSKFLNKPMEKFKSENMTAHPVKDDNDFYKYENFCVAVTDEYAKILPGIKWTNSEQK